VERTEKKLEMPFQVFVKIFKKWKKIARIHPIYNQHDWACL